MSRRERQRRRRRSKGGPGRIIFLALGVIVAGIAIAGLSFVGYVVSIAKSGPSLSDLRPKDQGSNSIIYAQDGTQLAVIQADNLRQPISSRFMPRTMRQATVAIEDKRFYKHGGVDFEGVVRAAIKNFQSKDTVQGGSTLTMQLIKNLYTEDRKKDYKRKIREAKLAEELENAHPGKEGKEWILSKYLNNVPYGTVGGQTAYGVQAAARVFFNKRARDLTLAESALLAGLPQAPSLYNPFKNPEDAKKRRAEVLEQMADVGYITPEQEAEAAAAPLGVKGTSYYRDKREAAFVDHVRAELIRRYGIKKVRQGGLRVYTTIDLAKQKAARAAIAKNLSAPGSPSAAIVSLDPKTGWIRAMATSQSYAESKFNIAAQGRRQPGSTFKIIVLMTALRRNIDIKKTYYMSKPLKFNWQGINIDVTNSDGKASGRAKSLFDAVVSSDNTVFQQLDLDMGPENVTRTAHDMGIASTLDSLPSEGLGGPRDCCTPLEMARAYNTINSGGFRKKPIAIVKVKFPDGHTDTSLGRTQSKKIFTDGQTYEAIQAMKANASRGTGTAANLGFCPTAGKTGTTSGFKDAWFSGMTSNLTTTVWVGYAKANLPMTAVPNWGTMFGGKAPASIWHDFMASVVNRDSCKEWPQPKQPLQSEPFFGEFTTGSSKSSEIFDDPTTPEDESQQSQTDADADPAGGTTTTPDANKKFPPEQYESPPAGAPKPTKPQNQGTAGNQGQAVQGTQGGAVGPPGR